jgi:hypothetical protein
MWTGMERAEYARPRHQPPDRGGPGHVRPDLPYEDRWFRMGTWRIDHDPGCEAYYRHLWSEPGAGVNWLLDWLLLDGFLRARGGTARYAYGWDVAPAKPTAQERDLMALLDPTTIYGGRLSSSDTSFVGISHAGGFAFGPGRHPLAAAHRHFAGRVADWLAGDGVWAGLR